ncbi:MAG: hypothetical protein LBF22_11120 [Deltaproteobacteria bacterium]|jgi:TPR repeat protein|nr:hypothetical protein [Deltaproteobacteria bacterium]
MESSDELKSLILLAEQEDPDSMFKLAVKYLKGEGVTPNIEKVIFYLDKASTLHHKGAMELYGIVLQNIFNRILHGK